MSGTERPSPAQRVAQLQAEARAIALDHVAQLMAALAHVAALAAEIADGGEAYPVGARETGRRLIGEAEGHGLRLGALLGRAQR